MKIGTDLSLKTCSEEGYLMMEYKVRELMPKGKLNPECLVYFYAHVPPYIIERYVGEPIEKTTDVLLTANDVWEKYLLDKESIDKFTDYEHNFPICPHSLLSLANDVNSYKGLE